jgi:alpha-tubulin suppressor-like RCC1 family protein
VLIYTLQVPMPESVTSGGNIVDIAAGASHVVALTQAGEVLAFGSNDEGECNVPANAKSNVVSVAAGRGYSAALLSTGEVVFWGWLRRSPYTLPSFAKSGVNTLIGARDTVFMLEGPGALTIQCLPCLSVAWWTGWLLLYLLSAKQPF